MITQLIEIAEEEIENTAQEAVKSVVIEKEAEIAYQKSLVNSWKCKATDLELQFDDVLESLNCETQRNKFLKGSVIIESAILTGIIGVFAFKIIGG